MSNVAIYSRKSKFTGKGDSVENQVEMCKNYINTMKIDANFIIYEDEGFTGGNLDRPQFKKLMNNIKANKVDILVCYRLDRISRNVADFSSTLEILQSHNCSFISIREQFDTSTPMGRAMIYIASVFAQLERETIAERVKDNMLEIAKNGRWTGGKIPYGFTSGKVVWVDDDGKTRECPKLTICTDEIAIVYFLYNKYLELGSLHKLEVYCTQNQIKSRNNISFSLSTLKIILQSPIYVKSNEVVSEYLSDKYNCVYGKYDGIHSYLTYNKTEQAKRNGKYTKVKKDIKESFAAVSAIEGYIEPELWITVQKQFEKNKDTFPRLGKTHNALLVGKLRCGKCKSYMLIQHGRLSVSGDKLFYYNCSLKRKSKKELCTNNNAKAADIEKLVLLSLKQLGINKTRYLTILEEQNNTLINSNTIENEKFKSNKLLKDKRNQIDKLVENLSKDLDIADILIDKIKTLKHECNDIELKLTNLDTKIKSLQVELINIDIIRTILDQCSIIDELPREKQKFIIDNLIDVIYWYGLGPKNGKIKIKFIGTDTDFEEIDLTDDEMLHFYSPSTCKVNKTTTFNEVFSDVENNNCDLYKDLPESTFAEKIYKLRVTNGLTQREFAMKVGVGYSCIPKYESGFNASKFNIIKICNSFYLDSDFFSYIYGKKN